MKAEVRIGAFPALAFGVLSCFWTGWVITVLWGWFVVPFGLASLSLSHAIGLWALVKFVTSYYRPGDQDHGAGVRISVVLFPYVSGLIALLIGFLAKAAQ